MRYRLIQGDALAVLKTLESESVLCVVTSPPYWQLRDYGVEGQLGLEPTPDAYLAAMTEVFREVRRVLRSDGTAWVNMGDSYATSGTRGDTRSGFNDRYFGTDNGDGKQGATSAEVPTGSSLPPGLKEKDLCGMPWRLAFALQADGWWLRSDIIWHKPNPMPSSVKDRPTTSHEYVFLLTKAARYYYDAEAIREQEETPGRSAKEIARQVKLRAIPSNRGRKPFEVSDSVGKWTGDGSSYTGGRNARTVWTIPTQAFSEAHFATYPEELAAKCILAGTSDYGACGACGTPWERVVEVSGGTVGKGWTDHSADMSAGMSQVVSVGSARDETGQAYARRTSGWQPACACGTEERRPCVVLDPFCGSGTTGLVALRYGRSFLGIELNPDYVKMAERRIAAVAAQPLLEEVTR